MKKYGTSDGPIEPEVDEAVRQAVQASYTDDDREAMLREQWEADRGDGDDNDA